MISPETSTIITLVVYALGALAAVSGMAVRNPLLRRWGCRLTLAGFVCQTMWLALGFHKFFPAGLSLGAYLQMLAWFTVLCGAALWRKLRQETPLLFSAPLCLMLFIMSAPYLNFSIHIPQSLKTSFYTLHIGTLYLSLALIALASIAGGLFLFLEGHIKGKQRMKGFWQDMPALTLLDKVNAIASLLGFPLYTIGIVSGLLWAGSVFGSTVSGDPKEIISIVVWLLFGILFHNRLANAWKGRKPAKLVIFIFILCLFSILVVNTVMQTHHAFSRS